MKNILIPTDFSKNSLNATAYAISLFEDKAVNFYFLHVSLMEEIDNEACYYKFSDTVLDQKVFYNPTEKLQSEIKKAKKLSTSTKHKFYSILEYVHFIEAIRKSVVENEVDYVVMGTKGASKISRDVLGSHTADVITKVKCTILAIPENAKYTPPKNIVFPTDFNILYKNNVLQTLSEVLKIKNAALSVLYVSKSEYNLSILQKKNQSYLQDYLQDKPHSFHFITNQNIDDAIEAFVENEKADMIAMVAKNLNFFQRILFQPAIEKISYHTKVPFLVLHE